MSLAWKAFSIKLFRFTFACVPQGAKTLRHTENVL